MASFLNQKFGQTVQSLAQTAIIELKVGSHTVIVKERLAEGGFGFVDLVTELHTKKDFVLKRCNVDRDTAFATVKKEINILQRFAGPYFVQLVDSDIITVNRTSREALLLLDYCPGGHLLERLNKRNGSYLPEESILRIFGQLLLALKPMHESNPPVVHRDLKLENILFGTDNKVRLCDFGSCVEGHIYVRNASEREAAEEVIAKETTQMYRAPEMVDLYMRDVLTEKTDIWALGCILYSMCFLHHPLQDAGSLGILSAKIVFPASSPFAADVHAFIMKMLDVDPEARLSIQQCLECTAALAGGRPLPDHPLSEEAASRRAQRIAANVLRENKNLKKQAPVAAPRKAVPLDNNSVAARRLAAKRGGGGTTPNPHTDFFSGAQSPSPVNHSQMTSPHFEVNFDAFGDSSTAAASAHNTSNQDDENQFSADFSGGSGNQTQRHSFTQHEQVHHPIAAASSSLADSSSLFDDYDDQPAPVFTPAPAPSTVPAFDAFGPTSSASFVDFDSAPAADFRSSFGDRHSFDHSAAADAFSVSDFHPSTKGNDDFFASSQSSQPIKSAADGFDLLSIGDDEEPAPAPRSSGGFDLFCDHPSATHDRLSFTAPSHLSRSQSVDHEAPVQFMDDLLIPVPLTPTVAAPSYPAPGRPLSSRDPASVLSLFDQPKPVPPPKPAKPVMLNGSLGGSMMGGTLGHSGMMPRPSPMGGPAAMSPSYPSPQSYSSGPMSGGGVRGPQQPFSPTAGSNMQQQGRNAYPVIHTNKSVDPFDSIHQTAGRR